MDIYIGLIMLFAGNFAPRGFALCNGQLLAISQYTALYSILGTSFGGDGRATFGLPDLRGRVPIGAGTGTGLPTYVLGEVGGSGNVTLTVQNLPPHNHLLAGNNQTNGKEFPGPNHVIAGSTQDKMYSSDPPNTTMNPQSISLTGNSQPISIVQPFQAVNYIIATEGLFPSRN